MQLVNKHNDVARLFFLGNLLLILFSILQGCRSIIYCILVDGNVNLTMHVLQDPLQETVLRILMHVP